MSRKQRHFFREPNKLAKRDSWWSQRFSVPLIVCIVLASFRYAVGDEDATLESNFYEGYQWQPVELVFKAELDHEDPFDFESAGFTGSFQGPEGARFTLPGFWDGGRTWKIRFTPTEQGTWMYTTAFTLPDHGLHEQKGQLNIKPAKTHNLLAQHGGFLKVSPNRRYLTFTDGTPFFWLGDTWWTAPSANVPFQDFSQMVEKRVAQGYTVFQSHGHRPIVLDVQPGEPLSWGEDRGTGAFEAIQKPHKGALRYWQETDRYLAHSHEKGLVGVIGFASWAQIREVSLDDLKRLWHYYIARYGAYGITFLITQEYNAGSGDLDKRLKKTLALGQFIKEIDPYKRAMSIHPWVHARDGREAWNEKWLDFIMLQAGHLQNASPRFYSAIYLDQSGKPFVEVEANYEAFQTESFHSDAAAVRRSAYTAIQAGSFGFTYGAQGLYGGVRNRDAAGPTARWGPVLTWREGLALPGGEQMQHLRSCYELVEWWKLEPRPSAVERAPGILVKADRDETFLLYYLAGKDIPPDTALKVGAEGASYNAAWFDPRTGKIDRVPGKIGEVKGRLILPYRPNQKDWMLILRKS